MPHITIIEYIMSKQKYDEYVKAWMPIKKMFRQGSIPSNVAENNNGGHTYALSHVSLIECDEHDEGQALKHHFWTQ